MWQTIGEINPVNYEWRSPGLIDSSATLLRLEILSTPQPGELNISSLLARRFWDDVGVSMSIRLFPEKSIKIIFFIDSHSAMTGIQSGIEFKKIIRYNRTRFNPGYSIKVEQHI